MESLGGRQQCHHTTVPNEQGWLPYNAMGTQLPYCAYLCYATPDVGTAIIPTSIWRAAQQAEGNVWAGSGMNGDRYHDHWAGYMDFLCQPRKFGDVIEFGAGPWTQFRGLLFKGNVPDSSVASYTILEPGANDYIARSPNCAYKTGRLQTLKDAKVFHAFPMSVISEPGEVGKDKGKQYDTVVSINVIEHVHNAFQYLTSLYDTLKPGGVLIFHDRYYPNPVFGDRILGRNPFHPIRLSKAVMDWFLSHFDIAFNNCDGIKNIPAWKQRDAHPNYAGEIGYYVIATKKMRHP
jgi:SAM-dependent methyltransferase